MLTPSHVCRSDVSASHLCRSRSPDLDLSTKRSCPVCDQAIANYRGGDLSVLALFALGRSCVPLCRARSPDLALFANNWHVCQIFRRSQTTEVGQLPRPGNGPKEAPPLHSEPFSKRTTTIKPAARCIIAKSLTSQPAPPAPLQSAR